RDRVATCIAGLAETVATPKLNRVLTREAAIHESLSNLLANQVASHSMLSLLYRPYRSMRTLVITNLEEWPEREGPSKEGWATTASVDYGSGRPAEGDATRSHTAMRGNCTTEDEPGTATYWLMLILLRLALLNWRGAPDA